MPHACWYLHLFYNGLVIQFCHRLPDTDKRGLYCKESGLSEFTGAPGSNAGDDFHELWATRHAIRLLSEETGLLALTVEGVAACDEAATNNDVWGGVDCALFFDGRTAKEAARVELEQLKYSASNPTAPWTVARLIAGASRDKSVIARLAKAWKAMKDLRAPPLSMPNTVLVSNQPVADEVNAAFAAAKAKPLPARTSKPAATAKHETKLAYASGLSPDDFQAFAQTIQFKCGAGSRFALEEKLLSAIAAWGDHDIEHMSLKFRRFIREFMKPERSGELITRESILVSCLGVSDATVVFPCPSEIKPVNTPVSRGPVREAANCLRTGLQYLCLHGVGGVGKTTALQEIEMALPTGSVMIMFDCYGGGRYLDPSALRHRPIDAFLQITNQLATQLKLPLLLSRNPGADYPKQFANRLTHAASAIKAQNPDALIVIAIDAADNAATAAESRTPVEPCFVHDLVLLSALPENVRFVVTSRTGRLDSLRLPSTYQRLEIEPFNQAETKENVHRIWPAPAAWIEDFHHFSGGIPRVQTYAFETMPGKPEDALESLRPSGKSLNDVFRQQFDLALRKNGKPTEVIRLCAGLIALPRPVPITDLASVLACPEAQIIDICADLAPGVRIQNNVISFADEDFEAFVRDEGIAQFYAMQQAVANRLLARAKDDSYAALHVAAALVAAKRGAELLELVELEPAPLAIVDPVLRREAEVSRLRLAINVCRAAGDVPKALRFVLIGAEGIKTEAAIKKLLIENPDLAAAFANETAGRLILADSSQIANYGAILFHKLSVDANRNDAISVREGKRLLNAWLQARDDQSDRTKNWDNRWEISISDVASSIEATLKLNGPAAAIKSLDQWSPRDIAIHIAATLPARMIAEGHTSKIAATVKILDPVGRLFLMIPLALAGHAVDIGAMESSLAELWRYRLKVVKFSGSTHAHSVHRHTLDTALTACEILTFHRAAPMLVDKVLAGFLVPELLRIERRYQQQSELLSFLFRAFALREVRAGNVPTSKNIFIQRSKPSPTTKTQANTQYEEGKDRKLMELTDAVFGIYAAVADALVNKKNHDDLLHCLQAAIGTLKGKEFQYSHRINTGEMRALAAQHLTVLFAAGYDPKTIKQCACQIYPNWPLGSDNQKEALFTRLALRDALHESLVLDVSEAAAETQKMRVGAAEKSRELVIYARMIKPLSPPDANAIFNQAITTASELDTEIMTQICLLDKLTAHGGGAFTAPRQTARNVAHVIVDAALRFDGYDGFPWDEAISTLTQLDLPIALASVAQWADTNIAYLSTTLPPLLATAMEQGNLTLGQTAALALLYEDNVELLRKIAGTAAEQNALPVLAEVCHEILIHHGRGNHDPLLQAIEKYRGKVPAVDALIRQCGFLATAQTKNTVEPENTEKPSHLPNIPNNYQWDRDTLVDAEKLISVINALRETTDSGHGWLDVQTLLRSVRNAVALRDRIAHLDAIAQLDKLHYPGGAAQGMIDTIEAWSANPAVKQWCQTKWPEVIVSRMPEFYCYFRYGPDELTPAIALTEQSANEVQHLILRGIEQHVDHFTAEHLFTLVRLIGKKLPANDCAELVDWYAARLASRVTDESDSDVRSNLSIPEKTDEAIARFIFALMGDFDVRIRWRAAHAARRLARTGEHATLHALMGQYARQEETAFRDFALPFYWNAARLWLMIAWDRIAGERPEIAATVADKLLQIALDDAYPHVLVRAFAHDACQKLLTKGHFALDSVQIDALRQVNVSRLPRQPTSGQPGYGLGVDVRSRFQFDAMDTLRYWYEPWLGLFANISCEKFLQAVEHWILDTWGHRGDVVFSDKGRRNDLTEREWQLSRNGHGSKPTLERLQNHLEWHGMWCALGELLKTEPLAASDRQYDWGSFAARVRDEQLAQGLAWAADLPTPLPLIPKNWLADSRPVANWIGEVDETDYRDEICNHDQPSHLVVNAHVERRNADRRETIRVCSALVESATGLSLLRALQTMNDSWDYKLPDDGEGDHELRKEPYRLLGWLRSSTWDTGIDGQDPMRGYAVAVKTAPGQRVTKACRLVRDTSGSAQWTAKGQQEPMFMFETWQNGSDDEARHLSHQETTGYRLLANKAQLQAFLIAQKMDLIIEVEITRRGQKNRTWSNDQDEAQEDRKFTRLYLIRSNGKLEVTTGNLGAWTDHCSATETTGARRGTDALDCASPC